MPKLFIVGFPKNMQEIELVELFSAHGTVHTLTIITDKNTGESKGYGFITMTDEAGAKRAILALDGVKIGGRIFNVRFAEEKQPAKPTVPRPKRPRRPF